MKGFELTARVIAAALVSPFIGDVAFAQDGAVDTRPGLAPDIREDETSLKAQKGNFVAVPIPISNPTLDTGLVAGAAYFYPQTEEERQKQPASLTAIGGLYTGNDSRALAIAQQNYWRNDSWRFTGAIGAADLRLSLLTGENSSADWRIHGAFLFAKLARRLQGNWYGGLLTRAIGAQQEIEITQQGEMRESDLDTGTDVQSVGLGVYVEYDTRDLPMNSYAGMHFKFDALFNAEAVGSSTTYQNYEAAFRSYHRLTESVVLAWELRACAREGTTPLWDACTIKLRGFSMTDYLGTVSGSGQVEARWQISKRWGAVGFAGSGYAGRTFSEVREREAIPSYGVGIRFMVLPPKRINIRLDYARSTDSDAVHLSVGEAF